MTTLVVSWLDVNSGTVTPPPRSRNWLKLLTSGASTSVIVFRSFPTLGVTCNRMPTSRFWRSWGTFANSVSPASSKSPSPLMSNWMSDTS